MSTASLKSLIQWLSADWGDSGNPVAVIEGFPGLGKTDAALEFRKNWGGGPTAYLSGASCVRFDDFLLGVASGLADSGLNRFAAEDDWHGVLHDVMRRERVLIILDDFDRVLDENRQIADDYLRRFVRSVAASRGEGRLLLVTNQSPETDEWLDSALIKTVTPPPPDESARFLRQEMARRGIAEAEVPVAMTTDIVMWLGNNPRAIRAFVACLRNEPLESIIDVNRESWELRNESPSRELLYQIERGFWEKTVGRLDPAAVALAENLSVYRRPFKLEAIKSAGASLPSWERAKDSLTGGFVLDRSLSYYSLNPIVRQLAAGSLHRQERRLIAAHSRAADHFAKRVGTGYRDLLRAGSAFVEARHHYAEAKLDRKLEELASRFRSQILPAMSRVSLEARDERTIREMVPVLISVLSTTNGIQARLRVALVEMLVQRGREGDDNLALQHATTASQQDGLSLQFWLLYLDLANRLESDQFLVTLAARSHERSHDWPRVVAGAAQFLLLRDQRGLALSVIDRVIEDASPDDKVSLISVQAFILARSSLVTNALALLRESFVGDDTVALSASSHRLFEEGCILALQFGSIKELTELEGVARLRADDRVEDRATLARVLRLVMLEEYESAAAVAESAIGYPAVAAQAAFCHLVIGNAPRALEIMWRSNPSRNRSQEWLTSIIAFSVGDADTYIEFLARSARPSVLTDEQVVDPRAWMWVWDRVPETYGSYPAYYFPRLPAGLTGLPHTLVRTPQGGSQHSLIFGADPRLPVQPSHASNVPGAPSINVDESGQARVVVDSEGDRPIPTQPASTVINLNVTNTAQAELGYAMSSDSYTNYGQAGAMGRHASNSGSLKFEGASAMEIVLAIDALRENALRSGDSQTAGHLTEIRDLAQAGDRQGFLSRLRGLAAWLGDKTADVGVGVAAGSLLALLH